MLGKGKIQKVGKNKQKAKMHTAVGNTQKVGKSKHKAKMGTGTSLCFKLL